MFSVLSFRPGLWPEGGGHLAAVTRHPQRPRLLSEQAGKPTSAVHSTARGALSCVKTIPGTPLTRTRCMNLAWSLDLLVRNATDRDGLGRYTDCCVLVASWLDLRFLKLVGKRLIVGPVACFPRCGRAGGTFPKSEPWAE